MTGEETKGATKTVQIPGGTSTIKITKPKLKPVGVAAKDDRIIKLESPTSISMQNTFLIKNADPSFEKCYATLRKKA